MKCRFIFFIGIICVYFLFVVLFFILKIGFKDGFFIVVVDNLFILFKVCVSLIVIVDFFFLVGVGVIVVIKINLLLGFLFFWRIFKLILVLYFLYCFILFFVNFNFLVIFIMFFFLVVCVIWILVIFLNFLNLKF